MGNKCHYSCINNSSNHEECDLSKRNTSLLMNCNDKDNRETYKSDYNARISNIDIKNPINDNALTNRNTETIQKRIINLNSNVKPINTNDYNFSSNYNINYSTIHKSKLKDKIFCSDLIKSLYKGNKFRIKYRNFLRGELAKHSQDLLEQYINFTKNGKGSKILNSKEQKIQNYLSTPWNEFYSKDPNKDLTDKINKTKKYKKGMIIEYKNDNYDSTNIPSLLQSSKSCYIGEVDLYSNQKCGYGETLFRDGGVEKGTYYKNEFTGWNTFVDNEGVIFVGLFNKFGLNGKGLRYNKDINHIYKGDFFNSLRHGYGKDYRNGAKYEGQFLENKKHGKGKIEFETGDTYEGDFKDNKFNGYGHYKWAKTGYEYIGNYSNGKFHGEGLYKWKENEYYNGEYVNGVKEGEGEISYSDGNKFFVNFTKGKPNGIGIYQDKYGNRAEVEFINGKLNKKYKPKK